MAQVKAGKYEEYGSITTSPKLEEKNVKKRQGKEGGVRINFISFGIFPAYCPKSYHTQVQNINRTEKY